MKPAPALLISRIFKGAFFSVFHRYRRPMGPATSVNRTSARCAGAAPPAPVWPLDSERQPAARTRRATATTGLVRGILGPFVPEGPTESSPAASVLGKGRRVLPSPGGTTFPTDPPSHDRSFTALSP